LGLFRLGKRRLRGDLTTAFQFHRGLIRKTERYVLVGAVPTREGVMALNKNRVDLDLISGRYFLQ